MEKTVNKSGERVTDTHIYFWNGIFSQWHRLGFIDLTSPAQEYNCAEQYMMAKKAETFGDEVSLKKIMNTKDARKQKALGRKVSGFDPAEWDKVKFDVVVQANRLKFSRPIPKQMLLNTKDKIIVEASPYDKIWGIGLHFDDDDVLDESLWQGENLLGKAIMQVREELK